MRLIDADALIEDLKGSLFYSDAIPFVEDALTAYDVEKVVAELKEELGKANFEKATKEANESFYSGLAYAYGQAIGIVKKVVQNE